jgi:hypothetical protein
MVGPRGLYVYVSCCTQGARIQGSGAGEGPSDEPIAPRHPDHISSRVITTTSITNSSVRTLTQGIVPTLSKGHAQPISGRGGHAVSDVTGCNYKIK